MNARALTLLLTLTGVPLHAGSAVPAVEDPAPFQLFDGLQRVDAETEILRGGGISILRSVLQYEQQRDEWTFSTAATFNHISVDYEPAIVTLPAERREETWEFSAAAARRLSEAWEIGVNARYYDGFSDYRSVWISEYYDQFAGFLPGYEAASPRGWSAGIEATWDYLPRTARLTAAISFGNDHIVPAWSPLGETVSRTRDALDTYSASLLWEAALSPRLKMQHTLRATDTTGRDVRLQARSEFAWALTDRLTLRAEAGGALEDPSFTARFGGLTLDYALGRGWHAGLSARLYDDSGEIVASNFNTAAPGLRSRELAAHLFWTRDTTSLRLSLGQLATHYDALSDDNLFFANLYRDRDFLSARIAFTHLF